MHMHCDLSKIGCLTLLSILITSKHARILSYATNFIFSAILEG